MAALGTPILYDPAVLVQKSTATALPMTVLDSTNLRYTFVGPSSGNVVVHMRCAVTGATTFPDIFLGIIENSPTSGLLRARMFPMGQRNQSLATTLQAQEAVFAITGLTPSTTYIWDAAYGVEGVVASTNLVYGGPNDAVGADAAGGFLFDVYDAQNLLGAVLYDPATAATKAITALGAMAVIDSTNARLTVTAPATGNIFWRVHGLVRGNTTAGQILAGILESTTVVARTAPVSGFPGTFSANNRNPFEASGTLTGVSAGSHTYDAAFGVQVVGAGSEAIRFGGPDDSTANNADGGLLFTLWAA